MNSQIAMDELNRNLSEWNLFKKKLILYFNKLEHCNAHK